MSKVAPKIHMSIRVLYCHYSIVCIYKRSEGGDGNTSRGFIILWGERLDSGRVSRFPDL